VRSLRVLVLTATALGVLAGVASDASAIDSRRPPPGSPDPREMVLRSSDLSNAHVTAQGYFRDTDFPSVSSYDREFEDARVGATRLLYVDSIAQVGRSAPTTASFLRTVRRVFASPQGRRLLAESFLEETEGLVTNVRVGRPRALGVGPDSFDLLLTFRLLGVRMQAHFAAFRVERVAGVLTVIGEPGEGVSRSVLTRLARVMSGRMGAQFGPRNLTVPGISGTTAVGQTLTASTGTWSGAPTSFAYQWQRCDPPGASCTAIAGATGQTYLVTDADVGFRLRVAVSGRSPSGSATALSTPTAVVPETGPPTNVAPPTITGTPQVGQTLTAAGAGTWTGNPVGFGFRWLRCDGAGGACGDIAGATAAAYLVTSADAGATIRVAVTARNSAGETTAISAQTAVVV
jgi:hypothetical protein